MLCGKVLSSDGRDEVLSSDGRDDVASMVSRFGTMSLSNYKQAFPSTWLWKYSMEMTKYGSRLDNGEGGRGEIDL